MIQTWKYFECYSTKKSDRVNLSEAVTAPAVFLALFPIQWNSSTQNHSFYAISLDPETVGSVPELFKNGLYDNEQLIFRHIIASFLFSCYLLQLKPRSSWPRADGSAYRADLGVEASALRRER